MKQNARKAFNALKKIGAPVLGPEKGWGGHFAISAERYGRDDGFYEGHKDEAPDGLPWADYYGEFQGGYPVVNQAIMDILHDNDLYVEWINAGVLGVYDL